MAVVLLWDTLGRKRVQLGIGSTPYRGQPADLVTSDPLQEGPWAKQGVSVESMQITFVYYGYHIGDLDVCKQ